MSKKRFVYVIFVRYERKARNGRWVKENDLYADQVGVCMTQRTAAACCRQHNKAELPETRFRSMWYYAILDVVSTKTFKE